MTLLEDELSEAKRKVQMKQDAEQDALMREVTRKIQRLKDEVGLNLM